MVGSHQIGAFILVPELTIFFRGSDLGKLYGNLWNYSSLLFAKNVVKVISKTNIEIENGRFLSVRF